jgi:hypothetical protein
LGQNLATSPQNGTGSEDSKHRHGHPHFIQPYLDQVDRVQEEANEYSEANDVEGDLDDVDSASSDDELADLKQKIEKEKKTKEVRSHIMQMLRDSAGQSIAYRRLCLKD